MAPGAFALMNSRQDAASLRKTRMLTTVAYRLGGETTYALEGAIFVAGAAVKWLRDGLKIITHASDTHDMALRVPDGHGVRTRCPPAWGLARRTGTPMRAGLDTPGLTLDSQAGCLGPRRAGIRSPIRRSI